VARARVLPACNPPSLPPFGEAVQRKVARRDLVPRRRDADLRLGEVLVFHAYRPQHATGGGLLQAVGDVTTTRFDVGIPSSGRRIGGGGHRISMPAPVARQMRGSYPVGV